VSDREEIRPLRDRCYLLMDTTQWEETRAVFTD